MNIIKTNIDGVLIIEPVCSKTPEDISLRASHEGKLMTRYTH